MIQSSIRNRRIISGGISFEKEDMKQQGCLGIYSGVDRLGLKEIKMYRGGIRWVY